jgi:twitching motility protein PilT
MSLDALVRMAQTNGASDLHLEPGLPPAIRVRGALRTAGEAIAAPALLDMARAVAGPEHWGQFLERRSSDLSRTIQGVRCRINILHTSRGVGMAIRLLASFQASLESLNLHPELKRFCTATNGLVLMSGPTGSGKSSTLAALIQEINVAETRHIITLESPIEYTFKPRKSYIRQREIGRDTPGFEQALLDALREDPDVVMVGEMREPETMRLTLNAAETGHLVLATLHSASCAEALQRVVAAFPAEIQSSVAAQLADCLLGVVAQRLKFRADLGIRIPECEILMPTHAIKNFIRNRDFFKITSALETGADHGMWTFQRYRNWLDQRKTWHVPGQTDEPVPDEPVADPLPVRLTAPAPPGAPRSAPVEKSKPGTGQRIEIEPVEGEFEKILRPRGET